MNKIQILRIIGLIALNASGVFAAEIDTNSTPMKSWWVNYHGTVRPWDKAGYKTNDLKHIYPGKIIATTPNDYFKGTYVILAPFEGMQYKPNGQLIINTVRSSDFSDPSFPNGWYEYQLQDGSWIAKIDEKLIVPAGKNEYLVAKYVKAIPSGFKGKSYTWKEFWNDMESRLTGIKGTLERR